MAKDIWTNALADIPDELINEGIQSCIKEGGDFPPSPATFRKLCVKRLDALSEDSAYRQYYATDYGKRTSHPLLLRIKDKLSIWDMRNLPETKTKKMFKEAYQEAVLEQEQAQIDFYKDEVQKIAHEG